LFGRKHFDRQVACGCGRDRHAILTAARWKTNVKTLRASGDRENPIADRQRLRDQATSV
jgi:hypothetical protein